MEHNITTVPNAAPPTIKNNYWVQNHENALLIIHKYSKLLTERYHNEYHVYKKRLYHYRVPTIIISAIAGLASISNSGYVPKNYFKFVSLFVGMLNMIVGVINVIENFRKIDVTVNKSYSSYVGFKNISNELSVILRLPVNERDGNGYTIVNAFYSKFQQLLSDSPILKDEPIDLFEITNIAYSNNLNSNITISHMLLQIPTKKTLQYSQTIIFL